MKKKQSPRAFVAWIENIERLAWLRKQDEHASLNRVLNLALAHYTNTVHAQTHAAPTAKCVLCEEEERNEHNA